jgi:hypothetical protein
MNLKTSVMFGPLLPKLSDDQNTLDAMLQRAGDMHIDAIWVDAMNPRPRVWAAVAELLRKEFPELSAYYRKILFDPTVRAQYLGELRARIALATQRAKLTDRVGACM